MNAASAENSSKKKKEKKKDISAEKTTPLLLGGYYANPTFLSFASCFNAIYFLKTHLEGLFEPFTFVNNPWTCSWLHRKGLNAQDKSFFAPPATAKLSGEAQLLVQLHWNCAGHGSRGQAVGRGGLKVQGSFRVVCEAKNRVKFVLSFLWHMQLVQFYFR